MLSEGGAGIEPEQAEQHWAMVVFGPAIVQLAGVPLLWCGLCIASLLGWYSRKNPKANSYHIFFLHFFFIADFSFFLFLLFLGPYSERNFF